MYVVICRGLAKVYLGLAGLAGLAELARVYPGLARGKEVSEVIARGKGKKVS